MYCVLKNSCKYEYKCCNFCKQKCDERCCENEKTCRFRSNEEPQIVQRFTINNEEYCVPTKKERKTVLESMQTSNVKVNVKITKNSNKSIKQKHKKKLI